MTGLPKIYDMCDDEMRDVTQKDVDIFVTTQRFMGQFFDVLWERHISPEEKVGKMVTIHARLMAHVRGDVK